MTQITIDRALVEQALEALEKSVAAMRGLYGGWRCESALKQADTQVTALRAVLAQPKSETCTWHQDGDSDSGLYGTSCRHYFNLEDGTPEDNRMQWCCYCGKKLAQELITENSDD